MNLSFIAKQQTPTKRVVSQLMFRGRRRFIYLAATKAYISLMRSSFFETQGLFSKIKKQYSADMVNDYLVHLCSDIKFRNINFSLWSRAKVFNIMFRVRSYKIYKVRVYKACYIKPNRRILLVWRWLGFICKFSKLQYKYYFDAFFFSYLTFLVPSIKDHKFTFLKSRSYKTFLLQSL